MHRPHIVILGAGFAGMTVAKELARLLPEEESCRITLVDRNNFSLFTPMLTEVVGGEVDPGSIVVAARALSPRVTFEQGHVETIDAANTSVTLTVGEGIPGVVGARRTLHADHLVMALGSVPNFHHIDGLAEHSLTINTVNDAETIRNRAIALLERADEDADSAARRALLTFVVGGGGFSGVETVAALNSMVRALVGDYRQVDAADVRMVIAQPGDRLLPEIGEKLAKYAQAELECRGVEVLLNTEVTGAGSGYVELKGAGSHAGKPYRIETQTVIWAGGVKPNPAVDSAGLELGRHHGIVVDSCCRVPGHAGLWALGDCAEIPQPGGKSTYAPTAQNATREGKQVAQNIVAAIRHEPPKPFVYHPIGELAVVGKRAGVASVYGIQFSGLLAWAMWRAIYLAKLPTLPKRAQVAVEWLLDSIAGRDVSNLPGISNEHKNSSGSSVKEPVRDLQSSA